MILVSGAAAQWSYVVLSSSPAFGYGVAGGQQVGNAGTLLRASLWYGNSPRVDLMPSGSTEGRVYGTNGTQQVGTVQIDPLGDRASLWSGTAASWVDLSPAGSTASEARGIDAHQQVGYARFGGDLQAGYWTGSPASWVSLHPSGSYTSSMAFAVDQGKQVGRVSLSTGPGHACLWTGTPGSMVDLHPIGSTSNLSTAFAIQGNRQVGSIFIGSQFNACMWNGTPASYVSLHPPGALRSEALGVSGDMQVGYVTTDRRRAVLWKGSPTGYTSLAAVLSSDYTSSIARGIWQDSVHTYVVGEAVNAVLGTTHAILWIGPPGASISGVVNFGDLSDRMFQPNPVTLEFYEVGTGVLVETRSVPLGTNGEYSAIPPRSGPLLVSLFEQTWLRRTMLADTTSGSVTVDFDLVNGDCDHDNEVAIGDYALLSTAFNSSPGNENWNPNADLNRDDGVDIGDFAILSANYGEVGD
ncbi:MAG TPA: hypothetical protein PLL78_03880 [Fimbriimonadaceae bacterium]|nr:hypothetical protein [Fimbriimonadaceae bacterium]HRJ95800.1 hypothetical protein [Fimbriimonadaceae bacterium]